MIAASEPLEFVPHGRIVLAKHPTRIYNKAHNSSASENSLLYKLTNFAIKDESLLETKENDEQEWWSIREVYYRSNECFDDEPSSTSSKDAKDEYMSESFRPLSRFRNDKSFNISVKSEILSGVKRMEMESGSAGPWSGSSANSSSSMSKKFNLNLGPNDGSRSKPLNPKTDCWYEEELYVKGCTAVWSKGLISTSSTKLAGPDHRDTIASFTLEDPIKHAIFCNFHVTINNTMLIDALNSQIGDSKKNIKMEDNTDHIKTEIMPSILLVDSNRNMRVFSSEGEEFRANIPFQVKNIWPTKYGVLLEKEATPVVHNSFLPTSFGRLNDSNQSVSNKSKIFPNMSARLRSESISGYDHDVPLPTCFSLSHPLDEVTPVLLKSSSQVLQYYNDGDLSVIFVSVQPSIVFLYDWKLGTHSLWKLRKTSRDECLTMCPNLNSSTVFSQSCDLNSPFHSNKNNVTSWATGVGSPFHSKKAPSTPSRSRLNSPMANAFHQHGMSPHLSIGQVSSASMMTNSMIQAPSSLPLYPDICLDHIWTDAHTIRRDPVTSQSDTKAFLHTDLVGRDYLCFMVRVKGVSKLQIMRLQKSHSQGSSSKTNIIVGSISSVTAKDAVVMDHLKMIALIDETGNIMLQSGNSVVGKVHAGGVLARLVESTWAWFPRRSSLLPTRRSDAFDESPLHLLSPVAPPSAPQATSRRAACWLRDAVGARLTLHSTGGAMFRVALPPPSCSHLVATALAALVRILPKDIAMQVIIKWYGVRNAPGTQDLTPEQEWAMFSNLLYTLIGYDVEKLTHQYEDNELTETATKKQRTSSDGTQDDWEYLLNTKLHKTVGNCIANTLHLPKLTSSEPKHGRSKNTRKELEKQVQFNTGSVLFPHVLQILYAFHLVYEELKLNTLLCNNLKPLSSFLYQISRDLRLDGYVNHYWLDFPVDYSIDLSEDSQMSDEVLGKVSEPNYFRKEPPNIFSYLNSMFKEIDVGHYPYLTDVNNTSRDIIEVLSLSGCGRGAGTAVVGSRNLASSTPRAHVRSASAHDRYCNAVLTLADRGYSARSLERLPSGVALAVRGVLLRVRGAPPPAAPLAVYELLARDDLALQARRAAGRPADTLALEALDKEIVYTRVNKKEVERTAAKASDEDIYTGMEHLDTKLLRLLYPKDHRMREVRNLLQSSIPVSINLTQRPEVSDHDFIEEQEKHLFALNTRTMALPVGRGMVTLRTLPLAPTSALSLPALCAAGRGPPPRCAAVPPPDGSPHALLWPAFHNAVAAGLALLPTTADRIHSSWIIFNKPKGSVEMSTEHAGCLMALGLNGHLRDMPFMNLYDYLIKCNEMLSIGLLLGLGATFRGTMDAQATRTMSIHLEPLLPPTSVELDLHQNIQAAALMGLGLVYQGSMHAHYAQVLLNEIGRPTGPEADGCVEREGYALAAGLALGSLAAGARDQAPSHLAPRLRALMLGGEHKDRGRLNLDVTAPGATLALGLLYFRSGRRAVADWLEPPRTAHLLDFVRPDLLMLRVIARGLILWDEIEASEEWVESQVPPSIKAHCFVKPVDPNIDYEAMNQAYCNIVSGACFALGLRFAGSGCEDARDTALHFARLFLALGASGAAELAGRASLESALCACLLAAAMVMCGRGDVTVLRLVRRVRARVPAPSAATPHAPLSHGGQMAAHCALGLLFLGGGRATLSTTAASIAALLAAFFPKFPTHSEDNRYHLQAFRHLYVLAVEPRLLLPRSLFTAELCYADLQVVDLTGAVQSLRAPCLLPELHRLREVRVADSRYWPITFRRGANWHQLEKLLEHTWCVDVAPRRGGKWREGECGGGLCGGWGVRGVSACTHLAPLPAGRCPDCLARADGVCRCRAPSPADRESSQLLNVIAHDCETSDTLCLLPIWVSFFKIIKTMKTEPSSSQMWQIKLLMSQVENQSRRAMDQMRVDSQDQEHNQDTDEPLISAEFTLAIKQRLGNVLDAWEMRISPYLRKYLGLPSSRKIGGCEEDTRRMLSAFVVLHDLPKDALRSLDSDDELDLVMELASRKLTADGISKVCSLIR